MRRLLSSIIFRTVGKMADGSLHSCELYQKIAFHNTDRKAVHVLTGGLAEDFAGLDLDGVRHDQFS